MYVLLTTVWDQTMFPLVSKINNSKHLKCLDCSVYEKILDAFCYEGPFWLFALHSIDPM